jgi:thiosulfate/3-mercaptopyruvate sulfurtransferase
VPSLNRFLALKAAFVFAVCVTIAVAVATVPTHSAQAGQAAGSDPWTPTQLVQPADLAEELSAAKSSTAPTIVYIGFRTLFEGGHIPGASFHGTASTEQGLAELKKWAVVLPRTTNLVIYCGCCPFDRCPNIRPAFAAFREMGFTHLRLVLPKSFAADWVEKGYAIEKGLQRPANAKGRPIRKDGTALGYDHAA